MNRKTAWILPLVILLAAGLVIAQDHAPAAKPIVVAIVDVSGVLNSLEEKAQVEAELQAEATTLKDEERTRKDELKQLDSDLKYLAVGTDDYNAKQQQLQMKQIELQTWSVYQTQRMSRESTRRIFELYQKFLAASERVAKSNGYDLVLYKEQPLDRIGANLDNLKPENLAEVIQSRKVVWAADGLDITDQVRTLMDNDFRSGEKK